MKTVKIATQDTNAFDYFELTERELDLLSKHKMPSIEMRSIEFRILSKLTVPQLTLLTKEAEEAELGFMRNVNSVILCAVGDYLGSIA